MKLSKESFSKKLVIFGIIVLALGIISLFVGEYDIKDGSYGLDVFFSTRLPRTISLMISGAALALSGLIIQTVVQNRFADSSITGAMDWSGLGIIFTYLFFPAPSIFFRITSAIIFSFIGSLIFICLLKRVRMYNPVIIPIVGIIFGSIISSISTFIAITFDLTQSLESWFIGSFSQIQSGRYEYLWLITGVTLITFKYANYLTLSTFGENFVTSLGVNYTRVVVLGLICASINTGIISAVVGNLPFLGLIVPNIISIYRGDDVKTSMPWVVLLGMAIITSCDILARLINRPFEVPVSLLLGIIGSVVFLIVVLKYRRS